MHSSLEFKTLLHRLVTHRNDYSHPSRLSISVQRSFILLILDQLLKAFRGVSETRC